jgi:pimeloyl-ACP methyl ester carboxylesterase
MITLTKNLIILLFVQILVQVMSMNTKISSSNKQVEHQPLTVLVHGLDSSSKTWESTMETINAPFLAVDQRGSGYSPLGDPEDFSQNALIEDLHQAILSSANDKKVVLLGHSLGGRVALGYAATYPEQIAALIIEDMDIAERTPDAHGVVQLIPYVGVFDRQRDSKDMLIQALIDVGYPYSFIEKGLATGRIEPNAADPSGSATWWSHINPDFRKLCYQHVLSTSQGRRDCQTIASLLNERKADFPVHVLVAGEEGTVCIEESIQEMKQILGYGLTIHRYPDAGHSIHSTEPEKFRETIKSIIDAAGEHVLEFLKLK